MISKRARSRIGGVTVAVVLIALGSILYWLHSNHSNTDDSGGGVAQQDASPGRLRSSEQRSEIAEQPPKVPVSQQPDGSLDRNMSSPYSVGAGTDAQGEKSFSGCIVEEDGKHLLKDAEARFYVLSGSEQPSVRGGDQVIVHGAVGDPRSSLGLPASNTRLHTIVSEIKVVKIDILSHTCKFAEHNKRTKDQTHGFDDFPKE
jgi:hypothetical protein